MAKARRFSRSAPEHPLRLEWWDAADLADNPRNWRRHPEQQMNALSDAIAEVGWAGACLYNEATGRLIDGHARKKVAKGPVPVLVGSWDEAQEAKILATLDPLAALATTDQQALAELLKDVQTDSEAIWTMLGDLTQGEELPLAETPALPDGDKPDYQQMTFTLHNDQAATVRQALDKAKSAGADTALNDNSNGNALAYIAESFLG